MKRVLLAVIIVACFSSVVLAVGLTRVYAIVNMDDAPVEIVDFGGYLGEDEDHITSVVQYKNRTERSIEAVAIAMIYYGPFNEKENSARAISTDICGPHAEFRGLWSTYGEPDFEKTAVAYVSAVRFIDGEVWRADIDEVLRKAGNMPELNFLSETEMLEIEKE